jgi:hypothetical protein
MKTLVISGNTLQETPWNVDDILSSVETKKDFITRLIDEEWFDNTSTCGLTYGQIRELNEFTLR